MRCLEILFCAIFPNVWFSFRVITNLFLYKFHVVILIRIVLNIKNENCDIQRCEVFQFYFIIINLGKYNQLIFRIINDEIKLFFLLNFKLIFN